MKTKQFSFLKALIFIGLLFGVRLTAQTGTSCSNAITVSTFSYCNNQVYTTSTNQMWFKFVAQSPNVNIAVNTNLFGTNTTHIHNVSLYAGTCASLTFITDDELPFVNTASKLNIDLID